MLLFVNMRSTSCYLWYSDRTMKSCHSLTPQFSVYSNILPLCLCLVKMYDSSLQRHLKLRAFRCVVVCSLKHVALWSDFSSSHYRDANSSKQELHTYLKLPLPCFVNLEKGEALQHNRKNPLDIPCGWKLWWACRIGLWWLQNEHGGLDCSWKNQHWYPTITFQYPRS